MALPHLLVLYHLLDTHLADNDYDDIYCDGLSPNYQAVVRDIATRHGLSVRGTERYGFFRAAWGMLVGLWRYVVLVFAQIVAFVWKRFHSQPNPTETVFVPHVNRFDSTRSVLEALDDDHEVVLPTSTATWLRERGDRYAAIREYDPTPLDYFATPSTMLDSLRRGVQLGIEVVVRRSFDRRLGEFLETEFDVAMPNTLWYLLGNLFATHVPSLANTVLAERMLSKLEPQNLVIGSLGSRQQAILYPAIQSGIHTYHIPHSATTGYELLPPSETVHFVPGSHVVDHLEASKQITTTDNLVPTGRPQLVALASQTVEPRNKSPPDAVRIVVATQPFPDTHRERFITDVLGAIEGMSVPVDVVIKIHPNEASTFYEESIAEQSYPVKIAEDGLHEYLAGADLVVTINSNVGLEAMVLGTAVACVTKWSPLIRARPYATGGPVPVLRSTDEIHAFFASIDDEMIAELTTSERRFVEAYYLHDTAVEDILHTIGDQHGLLENETKS
jgi:hypothetical protein